MRKLITLWLVCILVFSCILSASSAESAAEKELVSGNYAYTLLDDGTAAILRYEGEESDLTVASELDGIRVTAIGANAFHDDEALASVVIPEGIVSLGDYAFQRCSMLTDLSLPASLTEIGLNPFSGCSSLGGIEIAEGNPSLILADGVLFSREDRRLVYYPILRPKGPYSVPVNTRIIGASAFYECDNVTEIVFPDSITAIGRRAFYQCGSLKTVTGLENTSISTVGADAFSGCRHLTSIAFPENVTSIPGLPLPGGAVPSRDHHRHR